VNLELITKPYSTRERIFLRSGLRFPGVSKESAGA
jgi:hypothetical protein